MVIRTKYVIYPRFQIAIVVANILAMITFFAITLSFLSSSVTEMMELGKSAGFPEGHVYFKFIELQARSVFINLLIAFTVALLLSSLFFIWYSHRLVGPIVGLISYLKKYQQMRAEGKKPEPIRFRKYDFFHELAENLNAVLPDHNATSAPTNRKPE